jgi:meso-butanediol dehydrogenase/(S,S)-butanediol dehydrogenase/diacetyl reductase
MNSDSSQSKVAIVTGAGQGIGRAIAHRLARDGFAIAVVDINAGSLDGVKNEIEGLGGRVLPLTADLTKLEKFKRW